MKSTDLGAAPLTKSAIAISEAQCCLVTNLLSAPEDRFVMRLENSHLEIQICRKWGYLATTTVVNAPTAEAWCYSLNLHALSRLRADFRNGLPVENLDGRLCVKDGDLNLYLPTIQERSASSLVRKVGISAPAFRAAALARAIENCLPLAGATRPKEKPGTVQFSGGHVCAQKARLGGAVARIHGATMPTFAISATNAKRLRQLLPHMSPSVHIEVDGPRVVFFDRQTTVALNCEAAERIDPTALMAELPAESLVVGAPAMRKMQLFNELLLRPKRRDDVVALTLDYQSPRNTMAFRAINRMQPDYTSHGAIPVSRSIPSKVHTLDLEGFLAFSVDDGGAPVSIGFVRNGRVLHMRQNSDGMEAHVFITSIQAY